MLEGTGTGLSYSDLMGFTLERITWETERINEVREKLRDSVRSKT